MFKEIILPILIAILWVLMIIGYIKLLIDQRHQDKRFDELMDKELEMVALRKKQIVKELKEDKK